MKLIDKNKQLINQELEEWKKRTDKYKNVKDLPIKNYKAKYKKFQELQKWKEDLYFIKEGKEIIVSGGALMWLFLNGGKEEPYVPTDDMVKRYPNTILEEYKIAHRLKLFNLKISDFDYERVRESIMENGAK